MKVVIGFNNSENHLTENHIENPERVKNIIEYFKQHYLNSTIKNITFDETKITKLIELVHTKKHIENLKFLNYGKKYCCDCGRLITNETKCFTSCNSDNFETRSRDTYQTNSSFKIICEAINI